MYVHDCMHSLSFGKTVEWFTHHVIMLTFLRGIYCFVVITLSRHFNSILLSYFHLVWYISVCIYVRVSLSLAYCFVQNCPCYLRRANFSYDLRTSTTSCYIYKLKVSTSYMYEGFMDIEWWWLYDISNDCLVCTTGLLLRLWIFFFPSQCLNLFMF